ncbi:Membrane-fusion protein [Magnetospirillum sp. LM-5]|uniref:efflux RND transporter periplasmic adaptor subunit n=1 Tax=Magnetospirillum sp. LM-5 TaxID=2681466 RepID=UPI001381E0C1|nr:HlyD family efflux transporter periplasmic adaptor subunit [Magnetospirillum sp. LM-5]CAA7623863.1 Membrane-fusion protein [Magnetospirillum sp. LM-5]
MSAELSPLAALLALEQQIRTAENAAALHFVIVNDIRMLVEYRQAALFSADGALLAVSGVDAVERSSPFAQWVERACRHLAADRPLVAGATALNSQDGAEWGDWLPACALWLPLTGPDGRKFGTLLLAREAPWTEADLTLTERAALMAAFALAARDRPAPWQTWVRRIRHTPRLRLAAAAALLLALIFPVRLSVLAPAEIVASRPAVIRAPMDGTIEAILVTPNQEVAAGTLLASLDRTTLEGRAEVARKAVATAQAELDQVTQQSFFDPKAKAQVAVIKARIEERSAELAQLADQLDRSRIKAPRAGTAILDDPAEWQGRPVAVGERILAIADPDEVEVEAWLAPADLILLEAGGPVTVFLNSDPLSALSASLLYVTYESIARPDGQMAHRVRARLAPDSHARLGRKGTARLDGRRVPLIYWLARRPLGIIRSSLGF